MEDFLRNVIFGFEHVLDWKAYDHILFIALLAVPFLFKSWKKLLWLVTAFTIGHTVSLMLVAFASVTFSSRYIEFLVPVTIAITALYNIFTAGNRHRDNAPWIGIGISLFFGIVHGFAFSSAYKMLASGSDNEFLLLLEYALGIEGAQLVIVLAVLVLNFLFTGLFRFSKKDWVQVTSGIILGMVIPMLIARWIW
ncbi:MAG: HupE/UreJ family protein [Nonlabens sp.]|uniref:HupE/UreJ family protein n=1 Tax=Nonlabens sp. TaxID=1888209 RepID=UPI003EF85187